MAGSGMQPSTEIEADPEYLSFVPPAAVTDFDDVDQRDDSTILGGNSIVHIQDDSEETTPRGEFQRTIRDYRLLEFGTSALLLVLALVFAVIELNKRPIPGVRIPLNSTTVVWVLDPALDKKKVAEEVPTWAVTAIGIIIPIGTILVVNYALPRVCGVRVTAHDTRDFLLTLFQSVALTEVFTQFTKNITGRFRPNFYSMCGWNYDVMWDGGTNLCTDSAGEKEGRKSFPSGHASFAWGTLLVLTLYLLGRSRINYRISHETMLRGGKNTLMTFVCFAPVLLAAWISMTRCIDNWHNYSDILGGAAIGGASAVFSFNYNYGSVFNWESAGLSQEEIHKRRMAKREGERTYFHT